MNTKCKPPSHLRCESCPKRENCNGLVESNSSEQELMLNMLLEFETSICKTIEFTMNGRNAALQWLFYKMMSNKFRDIAKQIEPYVKEVPEIDIDWDNLTSIEQLSDTYSDSQDEKPDDEMPEWFNGDIEEV